MWQSVMMGAVGGFLISIIVSFTVGIDTFIATAVGMALGAIISAGYWVARRNDNGR